LSISANDGAGHTGNGGAGNITVGGNSLNHYVNINGTTNVDADGITIFTANLVARDLYGNTVAGDASINLGVTHTDANLTGTLSGTTTTINMASGTANISDLKYCAWGTMKLNVSGGTQSMDMARSNEYTMDIVIGTLNHYDIDITGPATAGVSIPANVIAKDCGNNTIPFTGAPLATISARQYQWTSGLNNSPEADAPTPLMLTNFQPTFNGTGIYPTAITFRNAETLAIGDIDITDNAGVPIVGSNTAALTIVPNIPDHIVFLGATTGTADNTTNYVLTIQSRDEWGNTVASPGDSNLTLDPVFVSGLANVGPLGGTISAIDLFHYG